MGFGQQPSLGLPQSKTAPRGIQILNGGRNFPKRGRLGTGAFFPGDQSNSDQIRGNVFGPNQAALALQRGIGAPRQFGTRSNAGNGTMPTDSRLTLGATETHPNAGFHRVSLQNFVPAISSNTGGRVESPFGPQPVIQPQTRNRLHFKKAIRTHHTTSGASRFMPVDTAFRRDPPPQKPRPPINPQNYTLQIMRTDPIPSFTSSQNLWYDPNNSFQKGQVNSIAGGVGKGRWHVVKRGAAG